MNRTIFWLLQALLLLTLALCGWKLWQQAVAYEKETLHIIGQLEADAQLENSGRKLLEALTFGLYDGYSAQLQRLNEHKALAQAYRDSVNQLTMIFFSIAGLIALSGWLRRRKLPDLGYALMSIAFVALVVGLTTPILSMEASRELPVLGETVFQFQSKGVLTTILSLQQHGNGWLALILFIFSVLLPVTKTLVTWLTLFSRTHHFSLRGLHLSRHLGKWSMADVFIVAILIAFFSSNQENGLTQAEVQAGLWFFASYVLLSLVGTQLIALGQKPVPMA